MALLNQVSTRVRFISVHMSFIRDGSIFILVNVSDVTRFHNVLVSSSRRESKGVACLVHKSPHSRVATILFLTWDYNNQTNVGASDIKEQAILVFTAKIAIL